MKKDSYLIPCDIIEDVIPKLKEYGILYIYLYIGLDPKEMGMNSDFIDKGLEYIQSLGLLSNMRLKSTIIPLNGTQKIIDFVEEARIKAEVKLKKDLNKEVITADTLIAKFQEDYIRVMNYPYKNILAKEKGMMKMLLKEYGEDKAMQIVHQGIMNWSYLTKKPLTIQNLYGIRDEVPISAPQKDSSNLEFL